MTSTRMPLPQSPTDVTPQWLSEVLGTTITKVHVEAVGTGQTGATYRLTPTYETTTDLPATLVIKLPSQDAEVRDRVAFGYRAEHAFYREVAATVAIPLPNVYHCEIACDGAEFALLMDDLAPAVQGDQIAGCGPDVARIAVEALAGLHGPRWNDPTWNDFTGTTMPKPTRESAAALGEIAKTASDLSLSRFGDRLTPADQALLRQAAAVTTEWLLLHPQRFALLHGDYRLDNLLFDPNHTRVTVVDWQTLTIGLPARDLSYFLATSLLPRDRVLHEHHLVGFYHDALRTHGVTDDYTLDVCWQDYRLGMLQVPMLTTLGHAFSVATARGDDMALVMLQRGCRALRDHHTLALIEELTT